MFVSSRCDLALARLGLISRDARRPRHSWCLGRTWNATSWLVPLVVQGHQLGGSDVAVADGLRVWKVIE